MKYDYKEPLGKVSDGSTNVDIESPKPKRGERIVLQRIAAKNKTAAFTKLSFGIGGHGEPIWFSEQDDPAEDTLYWEDEPIHLVFGEFLVARFNGTASGDELELNLLGYRESED